MYYYEDRIKAVRLSLKPGKRLRATIGQMCRAIKWITRPMCGLKSLWIARSIFAGIENVNKSQRREQ